MIPEECALRNASKKRERWEGVRSLISRRVLIFLQVPSLLPRKGFAASDCDGEMNRMSKNKSANFMIVLSRNRNFLTSSTVLRDIYEVKILQDIINQIKYQKPDKISKYTPWHTI
jgi:hypothetical protein